MRPKAASTTRPRKTPTLMMPTRIRRSHKPSLKARLQAHSHHPLKHRPKQGLVQKGKKKITKTLMQRKERARNPRRARRDRRPIRSQLLKRVPKLGASPPALPVRDGMAMAGRNIIEGISAIESGVRKAEKKATTALTSPRRLKTILPIAKRWTKCWV